MVYNRYAGIDSLPGADGKMPRPFRVDEEGNVLYLDEEREAAQRNDWKESGSGIMDWDELDRRLDDEREAAGLARRQEPIRLGETGSSIGTDMRRSALRGGEMVRP